MAKRKRHERVMIDTHIFIHYANNPSELSPYVREVLDDPNTEVCMSAESIREMVVAYNSRNISSPRWSSAADIVRDVVELYGISVLPISPEVTYRYSRLTLNEAQRHYDPSDHIIICHAITEHLPLISDDGKFPYYTGQGLELIQEK